MSRREFPAKIKFARWQHCGGRCEGDSCGIKLYTGNIFYDHDNPDGLTGEPTFENCRVLCRPCHDKKTRTVDVPQIAKAKRRERKHLGIRPRKSRPMPGTKASGIRRRMSGKVESWP